MVHDKDEDDDDLEQGTRCAVNEDSLEDDEDSTELS